MTETGSLPMNRDDEQTATDDDLLTADVETDEDLELAAYYRDLAEVNEAIANLYLVGGEARRVG
jgi:hypothetical protein